MTKLIPDNVETRKLAKKLAEKAKTLNYIKNVKPIKNKKSHK